MVIHYGLVCISKRSFEPEDFWMKTERGHEHWARTSSRAQTAFSTTDINFAYHTLNATIKKTSNVDYPPSDYQWQVDEISSFQETITPS